MPIPEKRHTPAQRQELEKLLGEAKFHKTKSFAGRYGFSIVFGARRLVGVGTAISDGEGNFEAKLKLFGGISKKGNPIKLTQWLQGTYEVYPDGTGVADVGITMEGVVDGKTIIQPKNAGDKPLPGHFDYVVLKAEKIGRHLVGVEMQGVDSTPAFDVEKLLANPASPVFEKPIQIGVSWFQWFPD